MLGINYAGARKLSYNCHKYRGPRAGSRPCRPIKADPEPILPCEKLLDATNALIADGPQLIEARRQSPRMTSKVSSLCSLYVVARHLSSTVPFLCSLIVLRRPSRRRSNAGLSIHRAALFPGVVAA